MSEPQATFEDLVGQLEYPMFVVTTAVEGQRAGCLVGFATQASIDPSRFLVALSRTNRTTSVAARAAVLVVHFLPADADDLAELFGGETGDEVDKFARCEWSPGPGGAPILARLDHWFAAHILGRFDFGDHVGHLLEPIEGQSRGGYTAFTFHRAKRIEPGHQP